jgi:phage terminase large subunit-like protein
LLAKESKSEAVVEDLEKDSEDLDEVLEEDFESGYEDKEQLNKMNPSLKIADDEYGESNEDS